MAYSSVGVSTIILERGSSLSSSESGFYRRRSAISRRNCGAEPGDFDGKRGVTRLPQARGRGVLEGGCFDDGEETELKKTRLRK